MSSNRSSYSKKQRPKQQGYGSLVCTSCEPRVLFPTHDALLKHMEEKRAQNPQDHIHCKFCGDDFITPEAERYHIQEHHPKHQSLTCPACGQGPFIRVAALAQHIERNECTKLSISQIQAVRDKKAEFAQKLIAQTNAPLKNHFTDFMPTSRKWTNEERYGDWGDLESSTEWVSAQSSWDADEYEANRPGENTFEDNFPVLGGSSQATESVALGAESLAESSSALAEGDADEERVGSAWVAPHLRGPSSKTPASAASDGSTSTIHTGRSSGWVPPHLRCPKKEESEENTLSGSVAVPKGKDKENVASGWIPPHLRGPKHNDQATTSTVDAGSFPKLGGKPTASVAAWTTPKNLFPDAPPAQKPTQQRLEAATSYNPNIQAWLDFDHPDHPQFTHARYWCSYSNAYTCPKVRCGKAFKKPGGLVSHLKGPAHGDKKYTCPYCHKEFASLQAVTAHSESASQRCHIRYTEGYNAYMDQLTSGIVDVAFNAHEDGTHKYETSVAAMKLWGNEETAKRIETERLAEKKQRNEELEQAVGAKEAKEAEEEERVRQAADFQSGLETLRAEHKKTKAANKENAGKNREYEMW